MTREYYPIAIKLKNKITVVVGGGKVAERKVDSLLEAGSKVRLISPDATPGLNQLSESGRIEWLRKRFSSRDLDSADLIVASTSDSAINKRVRAWAKKRKILINVVDQASLSDFISPAVLRAGKTIVTVYTNGKDPKFSRDLKNFLKENWDVFLSYRRRLQKRFS
nr:bifunctional precorrin-2 dehydrogenase/sirohydrochlorin ferrochelatase [Candidatus Omnitrophota bacterium]